MAVTSWSTAMSLVTNPRAPARIALFGKQRLFVHRADEHFDGVVMGDQFLDQFDAAAVVEGDVGDDDVRPGVEECLHCLGHAAGLSADGEVRLGLDGHSQSLANNRVIVHQ